MKNKTLPIPKMSDKEFRRKVDFLEGDIVQINAGKYKGRVAVIMRVDPFISPKGEESLSYCLRLSDRDAASLPGIYLRFIRHTDEADI